MAANPNLCFILGAGFTCAYSDHAPTMANFLKQSEGAGVYKPSSDHQALATISERYFGSPTAANIEDLATFLLVDHGSDPTKEKEQRPLAYHQLISVIRQTLAIIYNKPRSEASRKLFQEFAAFMVKNEICAITFNYDLLFDQLLRNTNEWLPIDGYGVHIPLAMPGVNPNAVRALEETGRTKDHGFGPVSKMLLFKLHGSLNWGTRFLPRMAGKGQIELGMAGALPNLGDIVAPIENTPMFLRRGARGSVSYFWRPFIVPPGVVYEPELGSGTILAEIWYTARWLIQSASEIHVLGYSLPPSDFEADTLIREGLYGWRPDPASKRMIVVNKDARVVERFNRYARPGVVEVEASPQQDVADYLREFMAHQ